MSRYHKFAFLMFVAFTLALVIQGVPADWAARLCCAVGLAGAYALSYNCLKFIEEKMDEFGIVWRSLR